MNSQNEDVNKLNEWRKNKAMILVVTDRLHLSLATAMFANSAEECQAVPMHNSSNAGRKRDQIFNSRYAHWRIPYDFGLGRRICSI